MTSLLGRKKKNISLLQWGQAVNFSTYLFCYEVNYSRNGENRCEEDKRCDETNT